MSAWIVVNLGKPFSGIEIEQGEGFAPTKIKIPFGDLASAWEAAGALDVDVVEDNPVIQGSLVSGEIER